MPGLLICILFLLFSWPVTAADLVINEFVPAPSAVNPEWVEFYNASESAEYLKSYYLDDDTSFDSDTGSSAKKILTNLNISNPRYPFFVFTSSILNNEGDTVVLFDPVGTIVDQFAYYDNPGGDVSIGRSPDQAGQFALLTAQTQGQINAPQASTPTSTSTPNPTPTAIPTPVNTPTPTPTRTPTPTKTPTATPKPTATPQASPSAASDVLGTTDPPATATPTVQKQSFTPIIISLSLVGLGLGILSLTLVWQKRNTLNLPDIS